MAAYNQIHCSRCSSLMAGEYDSIYLDMKQEHVAYMIVTVIPNGMYPAVGLAITRERVATCTGTSASSPHRRADHQSTTSPIMPHVEVLPNSAAAVAPGWTYVVDTGYDPSKVAINPRNKKRAAAAPGGQRGENELSARQQTAIARRIAELERDNDPKQVIPVPGKPSVPKTQNARRIIQYQRQIKHWLDDEEAQLAQQQQQQQPAPLLRRDTTNTRNTQSLFRQNTATSTSSEAMPPPSASTQSTRMDIDAASDDALLDVSGSLPSLLNSDVLESLLSAPPLSYAASHAAPPPAGGPPQRQFCDNCGYWGTIKCRKCGARVCGLECKDAHEATRCLKWA